jgi:hypothetical protein
MQMRSKVVLIVFSVFFILFLGLFLKESTFKRTSPRADVNLVTPPITNTSHENAQTAFNETTFTENPFEENTEQPSKSHPLNQLEKIQQDLHSITPPVTSLSSQNEPPTEKKMPLMKKGPEVMPSSKQDFLQSAPKKSTLDTLKKTSPTGNSPECFISSFTREKSHDCKEKRNVISLTGNKINWPNVCVRVNNQVVHYDFYDKAHNAIVLEEGLNCSDTIQVRYCEQPFSCKNPCRSAENDVFFNSIGIENEFTADSRETISGSEGNLNNEMRKMNQLIKTIEKKEAIYSGWKQQNQVKKCEQ